MHLFAAFARSIVKEAVGHVPVGRCVGATFFRPLGYRFYWVHDVFDVF